MFLATQLIGIAVISAYSPQVVSVVNETTGIVENVTITPTLPYGMQPPELKPEISLASIIVAIVIATALILIITKLRARLFMRIWFFAVVWISIALTFNAFFVRFAYRNFALLAAALALPFAFNKVFRRNIIIHNVTELLIYPGIAAVFVPILNIWTAAALLSAISAWDIYAVWHSQIMQNMAKFQIQQLNIFPGFFVPYMSKKEKAKLELLKKGKEKKQKTEIKIREIRGMVRAMKAAPEEKKKMRKIKKEKLKKEFAKIKVHLAILGGGDVAFSLIFAGVALRAFGLMNALIVVAFSTIALALLFIFSKKGRFYPAMPFITAGCWAGILLSLLI